MRLSLVLAGLAGAAVLAAPAAGQRLLHAGAHWAALERPNGLCEAMGRSELQALPGRTQARAAFAFTRDGKRRGELHLILSRPARPGAEALLAVGGESFLLVTRGPSAWSRGPPR
jgi:crotonobetainyl-CoA:carnitine CoA-transferase CaiB-like acyl-CoA transferase